MLIVIIVLVWQPGLVQLHHWIIRQHYKVRWSLVQKPILQALSDTSGYFEVPELSWALGESDISWWANDHRVLVLCKANYKSSPIPMLFFLVAPCNILRPLAAFWTWTNQYWSCDKTGVEEQSLSRPDPQYKGEAGEVPHDQHRFVCV